MLPAPWLRPALLVTLGLGAALAPALLYLGCGPQPIGVESCRHIEAARCEAAASCGFDQAAVDDCKLLYLDQCLHGIENTAHRPTESDTEACVAAVKAAGDCAAAAVATMSGCPAAPLVEDSPDRAPCDVVLSFAHELEACAFVEGEPDAGTVTDADASDGDGG